MNTLLIITECGNKTFGQDCVDNCSSNCADDGDCYHISGECTYGCKPGFKDAWCDEGMVNVANILIWCRWI